MQLLLYFFASLSNILIFFEDIFINSKPAAKNCSLLTEIEADQGDRRRQAAATFNHN